MRQSFFARRSFLLIVITVFCTPLVLRGTRLALLSNRNDIKDWLPEGFQQTEDHRWFEEHFPYEQFVLVSWDGCTLDDPRLPFLANELVNPRPAEHKPGAPWFFDQVITGESLVRELHERYPELSDLQVLRRLEGTLIGKDHYKTCLVVTLTDYALGKNLRHMVAKLEHLAKKYCDIDADQLRMGGPPVDNVAVDVEGEKTLFRLAGLSALVGLGISWLCFRSVRLTLIVFATALATAGVGLATVCYTGVVSWWLGFRDFSLSYGTVDAILLSMPSLVYVLALSGAVHIINYYHDSVRSHGLEGALERGLALGWRPCALAALTTALGLGSLLQSHLVPINKFGIYSAWGVMAALLLLFLFLPACLNFLPSREYARGGARNRPAHPGGGMLSPTNGCDGESVFVGIWRRVGGTVVRYNLLVTTVCVAAMIFFACGMGRIKTTVSIVKLFSPEADIIQHYTWLEKHLGPLVPMEVVVRIDNEKCGRRLNMVQRMRMVRDLERAVEKCSDEIGGALSAATFAPEMGKTYRNAKTRLSYSIRDSVTSKQLQRYRGDMRDYLTVDLEAADRKARQEGRDPNLDELGVPAEAARMLSARGLSSLMAILDRRQADESIEQTIRDAGVRPDLAAAAAQAIDGWRTDHGEELWRITARVKALTNVDYSEFMHDLGVTVETLLDAQYRVLTPADLAEGVQPVEGITVTYTGLVPLVYRAQHELISGLYRSLVTAFVLIALVMIIVLKSPSAGLLSMVPNLFPVVVIFGAMGWINFLVDVGTMMTSTVALGVAVDDTVHFLTWFRRGLDEGLERKKAVMLAYERCATAMTQTTIIAGLGLAAFAFSTFTPTQRFGVMMLTLLGAALFGDLVFLPAVLAGPAGRVFRAHKKKPSPHDAPPEAAPPQASPQDEVRAAGIVTPAVGPTPSGMSRPSSRVP